MTPQDKNQYHLSRTQPETVAPNPGPLFFFSGVNIAECIKASHAPIKPRIRRAKVDKPTKKNYKPYPPLIKIYKWSKYDDKRIKELYSQGLSYNLIAQKMNRKYNSVVCYIHRKILTFTP